MGNTTVKLPRIFLSPSLSISISAFLGAFCLAAFFGAALFLSVLCVTGCGGTVSTGGGGGGGGDGCTPSISSSTPESCPSRTPVAGVSFTGKVLASSQPVSGAIVQLYAAGNAGNGSAPESLLTNALATASDGSFTVPSGYLCPSAQTPVYLVSKGGQPASASAPTSAVWLMTALGPCGSINSGEAFVVNEVTTAASVWALASFMSGGGKVGASCTNTTGLDNAFFTASRLANYSTGASPGAGLPSTLTVPTTKLNSLANALTSCTNVASTASCAALFSAATSGSTVPANTLDAALNIARAPAANVAAIYALAVANPTFSPALTAAPPDWMLHNTVSGGGMNSPASLGVDASGNVWASNYFNTVSEFSPVGAVFPAGISGSGVNESYGMALDVQGNVWIANEQTTSQNGTGDITELNSSGQPIATAITSGGIYFPLAVAADTNGNMWIADYGDSKVSLLSSSGSAISSSSGWGGTSLAFPVALAIDADHNAWVANQGGLLPVTKISADGTEVTNYDCDCNGASGVATDQSGNVWIANYYGNSISEVNTCGKLEVDAAMGGGLVRPQGIAVDGAGTVWVANYQGNSLSELGSSSSATAGMLLSPSTGFGADAFLLAPYGVVIDASGNLWVTNSGKNTLTQFIGVAAPVKTPLAGPPQAP
jgi:streptogramin lyase